MFGAFHGRHGGVQKENFNINMRIREEVEYYVCRLYFIFDITFNQQIKQSFRYKTARISFHVG